MKVFVVVVTFNGMKWIKQCLGSLQHSIVPVDIIVVDNFSTDGTPEFIRKVFPQVKLFSLDENAGFGKANNIGISYALQQGCSYVYLLNQDAWIKDDTLEILIDVHRHYPEYGLLSPIQINAKEDKFDYNFEMGCSANCCPGFISDLFWSHLKEVYTISSVMAAHWLISAEILEKVGGFAPVFTHYGEDNNYTDRISYHGFKAGIVPRAKGIHDREFRKNSPQKEMYLLLPTYLVQVCNINRSFAQVFLHAFLKLTFNVFKKAYNYRSFLAFKFYFKAIFQLRKILRTRKVTKTTGKTFLQ